MAASLNICTWNIDRSGVRSKWRSAHQAEWLTSRSADICVVTEVHEGFEIEGRGAVAFSADGQAPYAGWEHAVGIWSRHPVVEHIRVGDASVACCVVLQTPVGAVVVYGTILPYRNAGQLDGKGAWEVHRCCLKSQIQDWETIRGARPDHHLVVAGDFNMTMEPSNAYVDRESRQRLLQTCENLSLPCLTKQDTRSELGRSNIDHVLVSSGLQLSAPVAYELPRIPVNGQARLLSDHNATGLTLAKR